jgi:hypothetical protein
MCIFLIDDVAAWVTANCHQLHPYLAISISQLQLLPVHTEPEPYMTWKRVCKGI